MGFFWIFFGWHINIEGVHGKDKVVLTLSSFRWPFLPCSSLAILECFQSKLENHFLFWDGLGINAVLLKPTLPLPPLSKQRDVFHNSSCQINSNSTLPFSIAKYLCLKNDSNNGFFYEEKSQKLTRHMLLIVISPILSLILCCSQNCLFSPNRNNPNSVGLVLK